MKKIAAILAVTLLAFAAPVFSGEDYVLTAAPVVCFADEAPDEESFDFVEDFDEYDEAEIPEKSAETVKNKKKRSPVFVLICCIGFGLLTGLIVLAIISSKLKSVHSKSNASDYRKPDSLKLRVCRDDFISKREEKTPRNANK